MVPSFIAGLTAPFVAVLAALLTIGGGGGIFILSLASLSFRSFSLSLSLVLLLATFPAGGAKGGGGAFFHTPVAVAGFAAGATLVSLVAPSSVVLSPISPVSVVGASSVSRSGSGSSSVFSSSQSISILPKKPLPLLNPPLLLLSVLRTNNPVCISDMTSFSSSTSPSSSSPPSSSSSYPSSSPSSPVSSSLSLSSFLTLLPLPLLPPPLLPESSPNLIPPDPSLSPSAGDGDPRTFTASPAPAIPPTNKACCNC